MHAVICFDIATLNAADRRRYREVVRELLDIGIRVQESVFELQVTRRSLVRLRHRLLAIIDKKRDSLLIFQIRTGRAHGKQGVITFARPWVV